jgi:hypothetical protein
MSSGSDRYSDEDRDARRGADAKLRVCADLFSCLDLEDAVTVIGEVHQQLRDDPQRQGARLH